MCKKTKNKLKRGQEWPIEKLVLFYCNSSQSCLINLFTCLLSIITLSGQSTYNKWLNVGQSTMMAVRVPHTLMQPNK